MDDENARCTHDSEKNAQLSLLDLPKEIFLHICSFLETSDLVHSLSLVCKLFYVNLKYDLLWKAQINHILPNASKTLLRPANCEPDKLFWKLSCIAIKKQTALWQPQDSMRKMTIKIPHCNGSVNFVLLKQVNGITYIVSAMNRNLFCHKLSSCEEHPFYEVGKYCNEYFPWSPYYCLTAIDHTIYGCSYNGRIKSWVLMNTGLVHQRTYEIDMNNVRDGLWCMASCPERALFATGSWRGTVYVFDSRSSNKPIMHYRPYTRFVNVLAMNTKYILSAGSHENTVSVWDQRAGRIMKSIIIPDKAGPAFISMRRDMVCVGGRKAKLHVLDPENNFQIVKSYSTEHTDNITGGRLTHGCLVTSSVDGTVRISIPTDPPKPLATLHSGFGAIDSMDYLSDTLAICNTEGNIAVWRPKCTC